MIDVICNEIVQVLAYGSSKLVIVRKSLNENLPYEPIVLIGTSVLFTHLIHKFLNQIPNQVGLCQYLKRQLYKTLRRIPMIKNEIASELNKTEQSIGEDFSKLFKGEDGKHGYITELPPKGLKDELILEKLQEYMDLGKFAWKDGAVCGAIFHGLKELTDFHNKVYDLTNWTNPLHPEVFPGICKMEAEIVRIVARLFNGDAETCGSITSGGTESLILAIKTYRNWGRDERGISRPEIVVPTTMHAAVNKAAEMLGIRIRVAPLNKGTFDVDVKAMEKLITKNTVMIAGSVPGFPHGIIDDIVAIAAIGIKHKVPVHVDACLGGFLVAFMEQAGYSLSPFDFRVRGVTSISADTHKYGFAPKGSSVILYSTKKYLKHQYFCEANWPGGIYASPTLAGSRSGAVIAGCWASLLYFGLDGYVDATRKIIETTKFIEKEVRKMEGVYIIGKPEVSVLAFGSDEFDIYRLSEDLGKKGWSVHNMQFPSSIHIVLTYFQTQGGVAQRFVTDMKNSVKEILKDPKMAPQGLAAVYGKAQKIPDRSIIDEFANIYLDTLYKTT